MKRKQIYQNLHPFTSHPFEAFFRESWHPVEQLSICGGLVSTKIIFKGVPLEEKIPASNLRVKSRKAVLADCTFLRQGVDVCVLTTLQNGEKADGKEGSSTSEPAWLDGKIRSMKRTEAHDEGQCKCEFYVSFYLEQGPNLIKGNKKLSRETSTMTIEDVSILQKLEPNPTEGEPYRWGFSEDSFSSQKHRLFSGKFAADVSWLSVASVAKRTAFEVSTVRNHLTYRVSGDDAPFFSLSFAMENDISTPVVLPVGGETCPDEEEAESYEVVELRRSKRRIVQPDRYMGCDKNIPDYDMEVRRLGENKYHRVVYDDDISEDSDAHDDEDGGDSDENRNTIFLPLSVQDDDKLLQQRYRGARDWYEAKRKARLRDYYSPFYKSRRDLGSTKLPRKHYKPSATTQNDPEEDGENGFANFKMPRGKTPKEIGEMVERYFYPRKSAGKKGAYGSDFMDMGGGGNGRFRTISSKVPRKKYAGNRSVLIKRNCYYVRDSIYDVRSFRKDSMTARVCRELIRTCMMNIDATLKDGPDTSSVSKHWNAFQPNENKVEEKAKEAAAEDEEEEEELSEIGMLWKEMHLAMASWYLEDNEDSAVGETSKSKAKDAREIRQEICNHDLRLDDEVGMVCQLCGFLETHIKDILPPFEEKTPSRAHHNKEKENVASNTDEPNKYQELDDHLSVPPTQTTLPNNVKQEKNVWALIPELKDKLRPHQKKAFKFLWRNIAGSLSPAQMTNPDRKRKTGGCVVSHTPGAGKTLLIIAFLVSYLKLFPGSRPLVLAPKTTLYTWYKEILKWNVGVPVYQIHGGQTYKGEVLKQRLRLAPGLPRNQDVLHVLDCLEKMNSWLSHPSILLMGYTSFLTLTREDSHYAHRKYMAQLLKQCPGIMILDEGHNPRSTKSRLRKGIMKVNTRLRILLSGTLFQNNFGEYFNTLNLARPVFADEVINTLDPKYDKTYKSVFSIENRGRKLLIDRISKKIDSKNESERAQALKTLKKLTGKFIDVYEGGGSAFDELPGLECYTLMMKATSVQLEILSKLQEKRSEQTKFPLDLEFLITLSAIHPWLITTSKVSTKFFDPPELLEFERFKFDVRCGSKVRFVMNLIPRCLLRNEKVLIFCHNISPINLFLRIFERFLGWKKGREVLVLQGDIELFERGRVIDMFEEPNGPSKVMLASITACAEGISLTAASRVILLDSEWNPAKSKQAIARAFRPGQSKVVYVYQLLATGTLEEEKHSRTTWKEWVSDMIFSDELVEDPSHWQAPKMEDELLKEIFEEDRASLFHKIMKNEKASNVIRGKGAVVKHAAAS